jgi:hypothetical protein
MPAAEGEAMSREMHGSFKRYLDDGRDGLPALDARTDVTVYKSNWDGTAWDRVKQRRPLRLRVCGPEAAEFRETFQTEPRAQVDWTGITEIDRALHMARRSQWRTGDNTQRIAVAADVLIATIAAARMLGAATLLVILALCLHAVDCGYKVELEFRSVVPMPWEQELIIHLTPK